MWMWMWMRLEMQTQTRTSAAPTPPAQPRPSPGGASVVMNVGGKLPPDYCMCIQSLLQACGATQARRRQKFTPEPGRVAVPRKAHAARVARGAGRVAENAWRTHATSVNTARHRDPPRPCGFRPSASVVPTDSRQGPAQSRHDVHRQTVRNRQAGRAVLRRRKAGKRHRPDSQRI